MENLNLTQKEKEARHEGLTIDDGLWGQTALDNDRAELMLSWFSWNWSEAGLS